MVEKKVSTKTKLVKEKEKLNAEAKLVKAEEKKLNAEAKLVKAEGKKLNAEAKLEKNKLKLKKYYNNNRGKTFKQISGAFGYKKTLSNNLINQFTGYTQQQKVGRPKGILKHTSPLTGKPVPAEVYYSHLRKFKRLQQQKIENEKEKQMIELTKKGISPNQLQQYEQLKQLKQYEQLKQLKQYEQLKQLKQYEQLKQLQQNQQRKLTIEELQKIKNELPNGTVIPQGTNIWKGRRATIGTEGGLFNKVKKIYGLPESFWN